MVKLISKTELKYIGIALAFSFILFVIILPNLVGDGVSSINPYIQFFIFNLALLFFFNIFLKATLSDIKIPIKKSFGLLLLFIALDIMIPPLSVGFNGTLATGPLLIGSASDYIAGLTLINLGMTGFPVYLVTYVVLPAILLLLSAILLKDLTEEVGWVD